MIRSPISVISKMPQNTFDETVEKYVEIKVLLKAALTTKINDREVYMKGIDVSYHYEGYNVYTTEELSS